MNKQNSKRKINIVLQNILEKYSLGGGLSISEMEFSSDELAFGMDGYKESLAYHRLAELEKIELILNGLRERDILTQARRKRRNHFNELVITDTYALSFPGDFRDKALELLRRWSGNSEVTPFQFIEAEPKKSEIEIGKLILYSDGSIEYAGKTLEMRGQMKTLAYLFMRNVNKVVLVDEIKEEIIASPKRAKVSNSTISKYVSELHGIFKEQYKRDVIFNEKKTGWRFSPAEDSDS